MADEPPFNIHELTVPEVQELVAEIDDADDLEALHAYETEHPQYDDGRKGVLDALEERAGELSVEDAGDADEGASEADPAEEDGPAEEESGPEPETTAEEPAAEEPSEEPDEPAPGEPGSTVLASVGGQEHEATVVRKVTALEVEIRDAARTRAMVGPDDWRGMV